MTSKIEEKMVNDGFFEIKEEVKPKKKKKEEPKVLSEYA